MPSVAKILIVFLGMLSLLRIRIPMGIAIILGAIALNFWAGQLPGKILASLGAGLCQTYLWLLVLVTALIVMFGQYLSTEKNSRIILSLARRWGGRHGRLWSLIAAPAVIGLIPMPAGALFSAPLIEQSVREKHWQPAWKAAINFWFRHIWEYWWPVYPAVIIALAVFKMPTWQYMLSLIVFTPVSLLAGYFFLLRPHRSRLLLTERQQPAESVQSLLSVLLPIGLILGCALFLPPVIAQIGSPCDVQISKLLSILIGIAVGLAVIFLSSGRKFIVSSLASLVKVRSLNILLTVGSIILFQFMLNESSLLPSASHELLGSGIPIFLVIMLLPLLAGVLTGMAVGFAGLSFPLIVGLMNVEGSSLTPMATLVLAYGFGYVGVLISPLHLCLLVSRDYFSSSLLPLYKQIAPCVGTVIVFTILLFSFFHAYGW